MNRILLDTNILVRFSDPNSRSRLAVRREIKRGSILTIVPQVLTEYWAVATRPSDMNGLGLNTDIAVNEIEEFKKHFELFYDLPACHIEWERLVKRHNVKGKQAHDTKLVAAMVAHGIPAILTFNSTDFQRFTEIDIIMP